MDNTTTQLYISFLEKTNQQLNLWSNPYGFLVSILSFLVAFLAITATIFLYRQNKEYKGLYKKAIKNYESALQKNLEKIGSEAEIKIQLFIDEKNKEMENLSGDAQKQAKELIDDLKKEKDSIGSMVQLSSIKNTQYQPLSFSDYADNIFELNTNPMVFNGIYCPNCGFYCGLSLGANYCSKCGSKL